MLFCFNSAYCFVSFLQIVLPVLFVTIAMLIGVIGGPSVRQEVPLELSTAMYFNESKAMGNHFVPFSDHGKYHKSYDATPQALMDTFKVNLGKSRYS